MTWDYEHYETAYAVFLSPAYDDAFPPDAIFDSRADAEDWVAHKREQASREDDEKHRRSPESYYQEAAIFHVRNCHVPYWNALDDPPEADPCPVPDFERNDLTEEVGQENDRLRAIGREIEEAVLKAVHEATKLLD